MKITRIIKRITLACTLSLLFLSAHAQGGAPYLEGGVLVTSGGYNASANGSIEQSIGQVAYTITQSNDFTLEQGVLHAYLIETPSIGKEPQKPTTPVESNEISSKIFPNPCSNRLNIEVSNAQDAIHYRIITSTGSLFLSGTFTGSRITLNVETLPSGLYIILLESSDGASVSQRFIKE